MDRCYVIAEAGVNHNGDPDLARQLIDVAAEAGADAVKFQTFNAKRLTTRSADKAAYQQSLTDPQESQQEMLRRLELAEEAHRPLQDYCSEVGIEFLSTPFDVEAVQFLDQLTIPRMKIPSGGLTDLPYLRAIGATGRPAILSTGMGTLEEVGEAISVLTEAGTPADKLVVLHANTQYPTPFIDVHLRAMQSIAKTYNVPVGYSDHTPGISVPIAAVALGAVVVEKHFTLDRTMDGPDHQASLEPDELCAMVAGVREIEQALGTTIKQPSPSELPNRPIARKSIIAATAITAGDLFTAANLTTKRPGDGISPMQWDTLLGRKATQSYQADAVISPAELSDD